MSHDAIPHYDLYGEPAQGAKADFLHLEMLEERSGPSNWKIRPHRHGDLHQGFLVTSGAGSISLDGASTDLPAPFLVLAPAGSVHAFTWPAGSEGFVLTVSDPLLRALLAPHPELETLFAQGFWIGLADEAEAATQLSDEMAAVSQEMAATDAYREMALRARLLLSLAQIARIRDQVAPAKGVRVSSDARLVTRFRDLVERRFRTHEAIAELAGELCVTEKKLRLACRRVAGVSPLQHLRARRVLEAKRLLTYSVMTISEIGYSLGFDDPTYFSRFFSSQVGESPAEFRAANRRLEEA